MGQGCYQGRIHASTEEDEHWRQVGIRLGSAGHDIISSALHLYCSPQDPEHLVYNRNCSSLEYMQCEVHLWKRQEVVILSTWIRNDSALACGIDVGILA